MELLPLDDPRWQTYRGGYGQNIVDVLPFLKRLISGSVEDTDWNILWDELHHQGDVGEASYAVVPYLAKYAELATPISWHVFGFAAVVELERFEAKNPPMPIDLAFSYNEALKILPKIALTRGQQVWGEDCFEPIMSCLALSLGYRIHARAYLDLTEQEIPEFYKYYGIST